MDIGKHLSIASYSVINTLRDSPRRPMEVNTVTPEELNIIS